MSETLFCVHISGRDDLIPVRDMAEAVRVAAFLNAEYLSMHQEMAKANQSPELIPYCFAAPQVWPYSARTHEEVMKGMISHAKKEHCPHWLCA